MSIEIKMNDYVGSFGENKDIAKSIRQEQIIPAILRGETVTLDFAGVTGVTQSFIHALVAEPIMRFKGQAFEHLFYLDANEQVSEVISIVYRYLQESFDDVEIIS